MENMFILVSISGMSSAVILCVELATPFLKGYRRTRVCSQKGNKNDQGTGKTLTQREIEKTVIAMLERRLVRRDRIKSI